MPEGEQPLSPGLPGDTESLMFAWESSTHVWAIDVWCSPSQAREGTCCEDWRPFCRCLCRLPVCSGPHQPLIKGESSSPHLCL